MIAMRRRSTSRNQVQRLFEEVANGVRDRAMNLLDQRGLIHRRDQKIIAIGAHALALSCR